MKTRPLLRIRYGSFQIFSFLSCTLERTLFWKLRRPADSVRRIEELRSHRVLDTLPL